MQIQMGNTFFIGEGSEQHGDHARLFIVDDEQRKELLGLKSDGRNDDVLVLNEDTVSELLAIRTKEKFNERLQALVKTDAEKKMIADIASKVGGDEVAAWKMKAINELAETVVL